VSKAQAPSAPPAASPAGPEGGAPAGASDVDEQMPKRFGKYTLLRRLALGGMAELFLALQRSVAGFEKLIVVKRVLPNLATDQNFVEMLLSEARIAARLNHPNVAHIYDVGVWEGDYFIAMEHIQGEDLRALVKQMMLKGERSFPLEHALGIVLGCCKGLAYAHGLRDMDGRPMHIVHRDVSPQNVLVTFSGEVKLVDFGIAKAVGSAKEDTKSGRLKGKAPYMSPEQAQGHELDSRSDIFSLGILLFELTTGKRLFRAKSEFDTLKRIVEAPYPRPREVNPSVPARLEAIILRALARDRDERYQSAHDLQSDLEAFVRDEKLVVSTLSLGEWIRTLFAEKLDEQEQMLQEGRLLAEKIAAQVEAEERQSLTSVPPPRPSRTPWVLMVLVLLAAAGAVAAFAITRPEPTPPPPSEIGAISIASTPSGAAVWIDGDRRPERTPAELGELPLGRYQVKLTSDGFHPLTRELHLTSEAPSAALDATLEPITAESFGVLRVRTTPVGASLLLDGRDTGETAPGTVSGISTGEAHSLVVALDGYVTQTVALTLERGQVRELDLTLERIPLGPNESILQLVTVPADARVQFAGASHETGSPYEFRVESGRYRVVVEKTNYRRAEQRVALEPGEITALRVELEREGRHPPPHSEISMQPEPAAPQGPGQLTFDARPWCNVSIGGRALGQTPIVNQTLPSGRHRLRCVNPELGLQRTVSVTIRPGETTRTRLQLQ